MALTPTGSSTKRRSLKRTMKDFYREDAIRQKELGGRVVRTPVPRRIRKWLHDHDQHRLCDVRMLVFSMPSEGNVGWRNIHRFGMRERGRRAILGLSRRYTFLSFHQSYVGHALEKLLWRWKPWKDWTSKLIWAELRKHNPGWDDEISEGMKDSDSGRTYKWDPDRESPSEPTESWKFDDPKQPEGWHEENGKWVIDAVGWWPDPFGYWRYTKPGDPGWRMKDDESWEYVRADGTIR